MSDRNQKINCTICFQDSNVLSMCKFCQKPICNSCVGVYIIYNI